MNCVYNNDINKIKEKYSIEKIDIFVVFIAVVLINLSNLSILTSTVFSKILSYTGVGVSFLYFFLRNKFFIEKKLIIPIFSVLLILITLVLVGVLLSIDYISAELFYSVIVCLIIFATGFLMRKFINKKLIVMLFIGYILSTFIVSLEIYSNYLIDYSLIDASYAYQSKNSISQLLVISILMLIYLITNNCSIIKKIFLLIVSGWLIYVLILLKSRTCILELVICFFAYIMYSNFKKTFKLILLLFITLFILLILVNDTLRDIVINQILLNNRGAQGIDAVSSGRITLIKEALTVLEENMVFGVGNYYVDFFPVNILLQFGFIVGIVFIIIAYIPNMFFVFKYDSKSILKALLVCIALSYAINSLFEGNAPYGPGVKCYIYWLIFGAFIWQKKDIKLKFQ